MWSPEQYERFARERRQPFDDLVCLIEPREQMRIADLGCGTGELTRALHRTLVAAETLGIDASESMLRKAAEFAGESVHFEKADISTFATERPFDLFFSNAALHWVPDHVEVFARLTSMLTRNGQLAIQMPANDDHPSHVVAAEVAENFGVRARPDFLLPLQHYASLLHRLGYARQHVRMQVYGHVLPSAGDVVEWVRGALLTHYQEQLEPKVFDEFLAQYRERLDAVLGDRQPYFYTYKRVLIWGVRN
jgi:trans-aconitate 2-methyltransferase